MVKKLSYAKSGKNPKKRGLMPWAFHVEDVASLYQSSVEEMISGLVSSPEQEDR